MDGRVSSIGRTAGSNSQMRKNPSNEYLNSSIAPPPQFGMPSPSSNEYAQSQNYADSAVNDQLARLKRV